MADLAAMRAEATRLFQVAIKAADPEAAVLKALDEKSIATQGRLFIIAFGKAAPAMARAALSRLDAYAALVVTHHENDQSVRGARVLTAGHPVPDDAGLNAAEEVISLLQNAGPDDHVLALVSGGASALLPAPAKGISLKDKQELNNLLLENGLDITTMNLVRQSVSRLKGGGFLKYAAPAKVTALILSDVIGDDLRAIASGPTVAPLGTVEDAKTALKHSGLWEKLPRSIADHLLNPTRLTAPVPLCENRLVGSNPISLAAMLEESKGRSRIVSSALVGDVEDAANRIAEIAHNEPTGPRVLLFGGETTVHIKGGGKGGRNQELAVRVAQALKEIKRPFVFLSGGTDGRDGPTDSAGGLVDNASLSRMVQAGLDIDQELGCNNSNALLFGSRDLIDIGATGTNVADVQILLLG